MDDAKAEALLQFVRDEYLTSIGRVITQWSLMEVVLENAIWQAAHLRNDLGRTVTSQMQVLGKLDLLQTLLSQTRPVLAEQFQPVANYIRNCLSGPRNIVAHGMWATPYVDSPALVSKFSARGKLVSQGGPRDIAELDELALRIAEVTRWLMKLCSLLPKLKQRSGGLTRTPPVPRNPQDCANQRMLALQPPTRRRRALPKTKTPKAARKRNRAQS